MRISHNLMAQNAQNRIKVVAGKRAKATEKLSSGYYINRAADDAAGLAISEKMRMLIRGLDQGTENAVDGISWNQIGDGALDEAQQILHRMTELSVKALNGTNSPSDRMYMEQEFEHLQSELDRISQTTEFNDMPIFDQHKIPYYQCEGNVKWDPQQMHVVTAGQNDLIFKYRDTETSPQKTLSITVPAGEYTTQELIDEIDTVLSAKTSDIILEFTQDGYCNANLEGGEMMDSVSGNLSYLLYNMYKGGAYGALIGTTAFPSETSALNIVSGHNNYMSFTIEDFDGNVTNKTVSIPSGMYTRSALIERLNEALSDTTVKATAYGSGIKLASEDAIVTGFKGNMFKIDGTKPTYTSVFYDNVKYGEVTQQPAVFTGAYVLPTDTRDKEHRYYDINSTNNTLILQPNGMENPVTLTIPEGKYSADQMVSQLNTLFTGLNLKAERIQGRVNGAYFDGIQITSGVKGPTSQVNIDMTSSAYNTLFVTSEYNQYGAKIYATNETRTDKEAYVTGSKDLSAITPATPLVVTKDSNDAFELRLNNDTTGYTIRLSEGTYNSVDAIVTELDKQLNGNNAAGGYKGMLTVSADANRIVLTGKEGQKIDTIDIKAITGNNGFDAIFRGYNVSVTHKTITDTGSITLDGAGDSSGNGMTITVDGKEHTVTWPAGATPDAIKTAIETQIPAKTVTSNNKFNPVTASGYTENRNFNGSDSGEDRVTYWYGNETGESKTLEGMAGYEYNVPATLTIGVPLDDSMTVTNANNQISLTLNGVTKTLTLTNKTYTPETLRQELQNKIDEAFTTGFGGATVELKGDKLVLTSRLPNKDSDDGARTNISCSTTGSSFLRELNTTRTPAVLTSNRNMESAITIDDSNRVFSFTYSETGAGNGRTIALTLDKGTYTPNTIVTEINKQLKNAQIGVTASLSGNKLVLTSSAVGQNVSIGYNTTTPGNSSASVLFGQLAVPHPADALVNLKTEGTINIVENDTDTFSIKVNGTTHTVTLDPGSYNRDKFVEMLNTKLAASGVEAYVSGDKIGFKTINKGSEQHLSINYDEGGTSMKAIYGVTTNDYSGVEVNYEADGRMTLTTTNPNSTISVSSENGGGFVKDEVTSTPKELSRTTGYHSEVKSYIDGVGLNGSVTIDQWNDTLNFKFADNGVTRDVAITIPAKADAYTYTELQNQLQTQIDAQVGGNGKIAVTVNDNGVRLEAVNPGSKYQFSGFSGDFYDKVICGCTKQTRTTTPKNVNGSQVVNSAFTVGRKDVRSQVSTIRKGISDELSFDLTYGNQVHTLEVTLDAGEYTADQLKTQLQTKINEALVDMGLPEGLIEVGVGGINTGVYGSNDQNALNFKLSDTIPAPGEGEFIIDGVKGNAAFEIFYQTDGKMEPAYIMGTKDVSQGVTIKPDETELSFVVDGETFDVALEEGKYTADALLDAVNVGLDAAGAPLVAELDEGKLKISHKKMGTHDIQEVSGSAKDTVFFNENGEKQVEERHVQLSSLVGDKIGLQRHVFNTAAIRINSICISKPKYAQKALGRIEEALRLISNIRSDFGSTQNRLEHAINNNENKEENLQSAESVIRDTDMAQMMVEQSKYNILLQVGQSMLAQANQLPQSVLSLLQ